MNIHLVAVEVCVERGTHTFVETQCLPLRHLYLEAHHADAMQAWLSIEDDDIPVPQMPLHDIPDFQFYLASERAHNYLIVLLVYDEIGPSFLVAFLNALLQQGQGISIHSLPDSEHSGHVLWDYHLIRP